MAYFSPQFSSPSPVLLMSPQPAHQSLGMASYTHHHAPPRSFGSFPSQFGQTRSGRPAASGRKRSREEASENLEPDVSLLRAEEPEEEWVYGPGMVLIKPSSRYVSDASTQSGTWLEEKKAAEDAAIQEARSLIRNPKMQRVANPPSISTTATNLSTLKNDLKSSPVEGSQAPTIDNFTLHLGIGWRKISEDEHIQAAARGWARFIENHYPVSNARILLESKGLQSYLVETSEGFFLFSENLRQGQLVSHTAEGALQNLQCSPPKFDGMETLSAVASSRSSSVRSEPATPDMEMTLD